MRPVITKICKLRASVRYEAARKLFSGVPTSLSGKALLICRIYGAARSLALQNTNESRLFSSLLEKSDRFGLCDRGNFPQFRQNCLGDANIDVHDCDCFRCIPCRAAGMRTHSFAASRSASQ